MVLTISPASVKLLCGITDTAQDAAITAAIGLMQPALEYALDPVILANTAADAGLLATLALGVTEAVAGAYVAAADRNPLAPPVQQLFKISTLEISTKPVLDSTKVGAALAASGLARLAPFSRAARALARAASGSDAAMDDQAAVPLLIGSGLGQAGAVGLAGPPPDAAFDAVLGTDGHAEPPGGDLRSAPFFGAFFGGPG